jgi:hypothetical protein
MTEAMEERHMSFQKAPLYYNMMIYGFSGGGL